MQFGMLLCVIVRKLHLLMHLKIVVEYPDSNSSVCIDNLSAL